MKLYKLQHHKYFTSFGAVIHLGTLKKVFGVSLEKAEIIDANDKEIKRIDNYLTEQAMEFEIEMDRLEKEDIIYSPYYYDRNGDLWVG